VFKIFKMGGETKIFFPKISPGGGNPKETRFFILGGGYIWGIKGFFICGGKFFLKK